MTDSMPTTFPVSDPAATEALGAALAELLQRGDAVCLIGPLGAGKTTFTRGLGRGLQVTDPVASPTFVIARQHRGPRVNLLHCDAYRVSTPEEFADLDLDTEGVVTVVEWGQSVMAEICDSWLEIEFDRGDGSEEHQRTVAIRGRGPRWGSEELAAVQQAWQQVLM